MTRRCLSFLLDLRCLAARLRRPLDVIVSSHTGPMRVITAILDEASDARVVRERLFGNGELVRASLGRACVAGVRRRPARASTELLDLARGREHAAELHAHPLLPRRRAAAGPSCSRAAPR